MSAHTPQHRIGTIARLRVTFAIELMGLRFPIASVEVRPPAMQTGRFGLPNSSSADTMGWTGACARMCARSRPCVAPFWECH